MVFSQQGHWPSNEVFNKGKIHLRRGFSFRD